MTSPTTDLPMGRFEGMREEEYNALPHVRRSSLWNMAQGGPAQAKYLEALPRKPTTSMALGTAVHTLVLEPDKFEERYAIGPGDRRGTNAWIEFEATCEVEGRIPIKQSEFDEMRGIAAGATKAGTEALRLLRGKNGTNEVVYAWGDHETGLPRKCRLDRIVEAKLGPVIVEFKTARDSSPSGFASSVASLGYHFQAADYWLGVEAATGVKPSAFVWVVTETSAPYWTRCYSIAPEALEIGKREVRAAIRRWADCSKSGRWEDDGNTITELGLSAWYAPKGILA